MVPIQPGTLDSLSQFNNGPGWYDTHLLAENDVPIQQEGTTQFHDAEKGAGLAIARCVDLMGA
jgi:hypothetical protein